MKLNFEMNFDNHLELGNFMHEVFDRYMENLVSITKIEKVEEVEEENPHVGSYAVWWDSTNINFTSDQDYNTMFLRKQMHYFSDKLKRDGYLFLNDVYSGLGFPKTRDGQFVGWLYRPDDENHLGDNYVDFEILTWHPDGTMRLDFNADGYIIDKAF